MYLLVNLPVISQHLIIQVIHRVFYSGGQISRHKSKPVERVAELGTCQKCEIGGSSICIGILIGSEIAFSCNSLHGGVDI